MALPSHLEEKSESELEDWFLTSTDAAEIPVNDMLAVIEEQSSIGNVERCEDWSALLQDNLVDRGNRLAAIRLLRMRCSWCADNSEFLKQCENTIARLLDDRLGKAFRECVTFDRKMKPNEALKRLEVLVQLAEGTLCHEKTWGFGVVKRVDDFYKRVTIDFAKKSGHEMSLAYAGEALEVVSADHILAMRYKQPDALSEMIKTQPDDVIRITLRSYGPMSVPALQEFLVEEVLGETEWKSFWDRARKGLKSDPLIEIPTRRNEPVRMLESEKSYGTDWLEALAREKDVPAILKLIDELEAAVKTFDAEQQSAVCKRLNFGIRAAEGKHADQLVRVMLTAARLGCEDGDPPVDVDHIRQSLLEDVALLQACTKLPVRDLHAFFEYMSSHEPAALVDALKRILFRVPAHALGETVDVIRASGEDLEVWERMHESLFRGELEAPMLSYLAEHLPLLEQCSLGSTGDLLNHILLILDRRAADGESVKHRKLLSAIFDDLAWIEAVLTPMDERSRRDCMRRVRECRGWDESMRRSVMGRIIKLFPDLQAETAATSEAEAPKVKFTSWRSHQERLDQLRELIEVAIPANSKDIGHARSYGDLRENFEYHAAKDQQGLLMRRKAEWERDLAEVRGTDFRSVTADVVGMGTGVELTRPDGRREAYWILGEWDRDEALNIISNKSEIAQRLEGASISDQVRMPDDGDTEKSEVSALKPLSEEVVAWVAGERAQK